MIGDKLTTTQNKKRLNGNILLHIFSFLTNDLINFIHCPSELLIFKFCNYINYTNVLYQFTNNNCLCSWLKCNECKDIISPSPNFNENIDYDYCIGCRTNRIINICKWCDLPFIANRSYDRVCNSVCCKEEDKSYYHEIASDRWYDTNSF